MQNRRVSSRDVAELAGVAQATVSRALRDGTSCSAETRRKVEEAARQLNYSIDSNASKLRSQRTNTLALLLNEERVVKGSFINPFFLSMLSSVVKATAKRGLDMLVSFQQDSADWLNDFGVSHKADGIIFLSYGNFQESAHKAYLEKAARLAENGMPFVTWGPADAGLPGHFVGSDNVAGARQAVHHLTTIGCKRIVFIGEHSENAPEFHDRYRGYSQALKEAGLPVDPELQVDALISEEAGYNAIHTLLERGVSFDGVFGSCDLMAIGAIKALQERGWKVPGDVAVIGFDDLPSAASNTPPLSTIRQDTEGAGESLVELLLALIHGEEPRDVVLPTSLVIRDSSRLLKV